MDPLDATFMKFLTFSYSPPKYIIPFRTSHKIHETHNLLELREVVRRELKLDVDQIWEDLRKLTIHYTVFELSGRR